MCNAPITTQNTPARVTPNSPWRMDSLQILDNWKLQVTFQDGTQGVIDLSRLIFSERAGIFAALRDLTVFRQVNLICGVPTWPGEIDLAPDTAHRMILAHGSYQPQA